MFDQNFPVLVALFLCCMCGPAFAAQDGVRQQNVLSDGELRKAPDEGESTGDFDRFVVLNEKLKTAVCDENVLSRAPTLESISNPDDSGKYHEFVVQLAGGMTESEVMSFLLGDSLVGIQSEFVKKQVTGAFEGRGLGGAVSARTLTADQFLEAQALLAGVKRRVSLEICDGLVNFGRLHKMLNSKPSRFLHAVPDEASATLESKGSRKDGDFLVVALDQQGRFGRVGDRLASRTAKFLVPGWLEPFEVDRILVTKKSLRIYRRISNPVTNNTQSIELIGQQGMPLGLLYLSHDPTEGDWTRYRNGAELPETRVKQIETYRQRIEFEALRAIEKKSTARTAVRDLQEFYKNLLQAYQLFPNEKQFDAYAKTYVRKTSLEDITKNVLGSDFLTSLKQARVNGSYVHLALFKPDPKLHAIYLEYSLRLKKLLTD